MQFRKSSISTNTKNVVQSAKLVEICSIPGVTPVGIFMFKVNNRNTRTKCEIFSKLTIKTERR